MDLTKSYILNVLPVQHTFKYCDIYHYELKIIEQKIAASVNAKNIHNALDIPDFRHVKDAKISIPVIKLSISKLKIFDNYTIENNSNNLTLINNNIRHQIIQFESGKLPVIKIKEKKLLFFMHQPGFKRIFFCGSYSLKNDITKSNLDKFYEVNCHEGTNYFVNFNILKN